MFASGSSRRAFITAAHHAALAPVAPAALKWSAKAAHGEVTFTCVPPGSGVRIALDRDGDGALDGDERLAGTDPADPNSKP